MPENWMTTEQEITMPHTPGPWRLHPENIPYVICGEDGPSFGLITYAGSMDEIMADARLMAAAPDLLAILKAAAEDDVVQWHDGLRPCRPRGDSEGRGTAMTTVSRKSST